MDILQFLFIVFAAIIAYQVLAPLLFTVLLVGILWYLYQSSYEGFASWYGYGSYDNLSTPGYGGDPTYCQNCNQQSSSDPSFCLSCLNCAYTNGMCVNRPGYPNVGTVAPYTIFGSNNLYPYSSFGDNIWGLISPLY